MICLRVSHYFFSNHSIMKFVLKILVIRLFLSACQSKINNPNHRLSSSESENTPDRIEKWKAMKFGMFIHWGVYSIPAGVWEGKQVEKLGEQIMRHADISVSDYKAINPEFGDKDDFKNLVNTAHDNGIYVIVDWVPNHTGWDHPWISAHPNWYTQNEKGEIIDPINPDTGKSWGWTDVADLNHENKEMQNAMINDLKYWVENFNIDGYRMDVAHKVPPLFFNKAITELRKIKPLFMLAEAEQHELFRNGFDMQYAWEGHHILNKIAKGEANVTDFDVYMKKQEELLEASDFNMNFVTNHDENSWNGTIKERMGDASEVFTVLVYAMPGMPLIYSGQEYDLNHRLKFFEKDSIPKIKGNTWNLLEKLGSLKNNTIALNGGKNATNYERLQTENENVLTFKRGKENDAVYFIGNLSNKTQTFTIDLKGSYLDLIKQENVVFDTKKITLKPWQYYLIK